MNVPTAGKNGFTYHELDGSKAFRLLDLLPGQRSDPIQCMLIHDSLALRPEFYALSYTWGSAGDSLPVLINNLTMNIQKNLYEFLIELRLVDRPRRVWADAVCINQQDIPERNSQVLLMKEVYSCAQSVLVWLGPHSERSDRLFRFFYEIIASQAYQQEQESADDSETSDHFELFENDHTLFGEAEIPKRRFNEYLHALSCRPYWRRVWIIQEVWLARNIRAFCGNMSIPWADFIKILTIYQKICLGSEVSKAMHRSVVHEALQRVCDLRSQRSTFDLFKIATFDPPLECFDPRDRIYGLLGLLPNPSASGIVVDYESPAEELFFSVIRHIAHWADSIQGYIKIFRDLADNLNSTPMKCLSYATKVLQNWDFNQHELAAFTKSDSGIKKYIFGPESLAHFSNVDIMKDDLLVELEWPLIAVLRSFDQEKYTYTMIGECTAVEGPQNGQSILNYLPGSPLPAPLNIYLHEGNSLGKTVEMKLSILRILRAMALVDYIQQQTSVVQAFPAKVGDELSTGQASIHTKDWDHDLQTNRESKTGTSVSYSSTWVSVKFLSRTGQWRHQWVRWESEWIEKRWSDDEVRVI